MSMSHIFRTGETQKQTIQIQMLTNISIERKDITCSTRVSLGNQRKQVLITCNMLHSFHQPINITKNKESITNHLWRPAPLSNKNNAAGAHRLHYSSSKR